MTAVQLIENDATVRAIFRALQKGGGKASGWAAAKSVGKDPSSVVAALEKLRELGVVDSAGSGLEAYYYLTDLGFSVYEHVGRLP